MADFDFNLTARPVLDGADLTIGENRIVERSDLAIVSVAAPLGGEDALRAAFARRWSLDLPAPTRSADRGPLRAIRTGADQVLLIFPEAHMTWLDVRSALDGSGYTTDQTDAWVVLEISGPETPAALERLCPLDVDAARFPVGAAGRTLMAHLGVIVLRLGEEKFWLMSAASSARSFLDAAATAFRNVIT